MNSPCMRPKTYDVIDDVKNFRSEIGILYVNDFNQKVLYKLFRDCGLEFHELLRCGIYVYLWKGHPLANRKLISLEDLREYPCLSFDQGAHGSFYFAEEVLSTYEYKRIIKANDRATLLNLMIGLNAYTLCSGIICEELNGSDYCAVKLDSNEVDDHRLPGPQGHQDQPHWPAVPGGNLQIPRQRFVIVLSYSQL